MKLKKTTEAVSSLIVNRFSFSHCHKSIEMTEPTEVKKNAFKSVNETISVSDQRVSLVENDTKKKIKREMRGR